MRLSGTPSRWPRPPEATARFNLVAYCSSMALCLGYAADEYFDLRKWKTVAVAVPGTSTALSLRARVRPPPIGCCTWPGGSVMLHWAVDVAGLADDPSAVVLELGSGIGTAALGLAAAARARGGGGAVIASDVCAASLDNLRANAASNGFDATGSTSTALRVCRLDAAAGAAALESLPVAPSALTHVVGSDVVYHGFDRHDTGDAGDAGEGAVPRLEHTLAALLRAQPSVRITLLLEDRFSGGAVAALAGAAGVSHASTTRDPAILAFEEGCERLGLRVQRRAVPEAVVESVSRSQGWLQRAAWWVAGTWDGLTLFEVTND